MDEIKLTAGGPIEGTFEIDLSKGPGGYEFRGKRGSGKTTLISSIDLLSGHKVDVTLHDGALSGKVEGFGVVAPIGGRKRRKGELGLDTIDAEKFSLIDLIDPPGKTPEVRDAHAIKALAVLSEVKADPELYYELAGGQAGFDGLGIQKSDDPVLLATRVKQAYDKQARASQNTADAEAAHAAPLEVVPEGLDISQSSDLEALGSARDEARDQLQAWKSDRESGQQAEREADEAMERLEKLKAEYKGSSVAYAEDCVKQSAEMAQKEKQAMQAILAQVAEAKEVAVNAERAAQHAVEFLNTAKQHAAAVSALEDTAARKVTYPTTDNIATAQADVAATSLEYDQGVLIRDVKISQGRATKHREAAGQAEKAADEAKNIAGQVFDLLAQSLHTQHLTIRSVDGNPRLFVQHPNRGRTAFDRVNGLSAGERVDFTLRELLPHLESPGLLPIPQSCWQDLQPSDRQNLHKLAVEKGLFLFGAQIDDGDLRVVYLGDE